MKVFQPTCILLYVPLKREIAISLAFEISQKATGFVRCPRRRLNRLPPPALDQNISVPDLPLDIQKGRCIAVPIGCGWPQVAVQLLEGKPTIYLQPNMVIVFSNGKLGTSPHSSG